MSTASSYGLRYVPASCLVVARPVASAWWRPCCLLLAADSALVPSSHAHTRQGVYQMQPALPPIGALLKLQPGHCDPTVNM